MPATQFDEAIGRFHPVFLHFPIVLFTAALVCDLLNYFNKVKAFTAGHWFIIFGTLACIPTIVTGLAAAESFDPTDPILIKHLYLGYATGICGSLYAGLRISAMWWPLPLRPVHYVWLSILMVALVSWASDYGGLITRGVTPFSSVELPRDSEKSVNFEAITSQELDAQLGHPITLQDVVPIFASHQCGQCHPGNFSNGFPQNFFVHGEDGLFLEKHEDGSLKNYEDSVFYQTVILKNRMPLKTGLKLKDRLILLAWLRNGAPMK